MNSHRLLFAALMVCASVFTLGVSTLSAAPVYYDEAIDGDLPGNSYPDLRPTLIFDIGLNTIKGSGRFVLEDEEDFELREFDSDELLFTIALGQQLTTVTFYFDLTKDQNTSWVAGIGPEIRNHVPPTLERGIGALESVILSSAVSPVDSSPVDLFSNVLPLGKPGVGLYSYGYSSLHGPFTDRLPGNAEIEYNYTTVFEVTSGPTPPPPFASIDVTPINPSITLGASQSFTATGTFSDGSTQQLLNSPVTALAAGGNHSCALLVSGAVQCWGNNSEGQLGNGTTTASTTPVPVSGISTATAVAVGTSHSCAVLAGGSVQCWGDNRFGQLGNGTTTSSTTPITVSGISTATVVEMGSSHSCALLASGAMQCWGSNGWGQLGNGTTTASTTPVTVRGISTATAVAAGNLHSCALLASGAVQCWGRNGEGQLGIGTTNNISLTPVTVIGISTATALATGSSHNCAVLASGAVQCWGYNLFGQLGNGTTNNIFLSPVTVIGISTATALAAGDNHSCALLVSGVVQCWGINQDGELGNGTTTASTTPVTVSGINTATALAGGSWHSCALLASGAVQCWGRNTEGQLGNGTTTASTTPVTVRGINTATALAAGSLHSCAVLASGEVQCWGDNKWGQLGIGTTTVNSTTPVTVRGISTATAVATGDLHSCALLASGEVQCWGNNRFGQLGNGTTTSSTTPITVSGISTATALATGFSHSCALLASGAVQCWGRNKEGQLGNGTKTASTTPVAVSGVSNATAVSVGRLHSCAVLASGAVQCWGDNGQGQLGNGTTTSSKTPVRVRRISSATAVATGSSHSCALLASGAVQCWGNNTVGQLGNGTTTVNSTTPVNVTGISAATALAAGGGHSCVLLSSGAVQCWGDNGQGQLGNGTTTASTTPVTVSGISSATAVAAGASHSCALLTSGVVQCWGWNINGQLGNGGGVVNPTPQLSVIGTPGVVWSSDTPSVASITGAGLATGLSLGSTLITATVGSISGSTALWVDAQVFSLSLIALGDGTVTGTGTYNPGQTATVTATANAGSTFTGWTGANATECATGSVLMDADKICTATFTPTTNTLPAAPTIGTATPGNSRAIVAFTPGALGSGTLINYTAQCGSFTATGTSSPLGVTGLTNGTTYTCQVKTTSSVGDSPWSAASNSVTPSASVPDAPTIGTATAGNASASVAFTPGDLGSGTLINYTANCGGFTATGTSSPITVTGLTNGTAYTCKVRTSSSVGDSLWSADSNSVTPSGGGNALPAAPTIGTATPGDRSAIVSFTPNDLGSGTLRFYKSKCGSETATSTSSPITVTGLTNGTTYTCTVRAITSVGNSPSSAESNPVTPSAGGSTLPAAPTIGTATPGNARAIVAFTPGALGSGTLINYTAQCGSFTATGTSSPITVTGLTNGTAYTCKVRTSSSVGDSLWSADSNSVTPFTNVNNISVNTNIPDIAIGDGKCALIEAINEAQTPGSSYGDCPLGSDGADTITLETSGPYSLTSVNNDTDGPNGLPSITTEITINGNGATIERGLSWFEAGFRIFHVGPAGTLRMNQLSVRGGYSNDYINDRSYSGAGIYNTGKLALFNCRLYENLTDALGGGIWNAASGTAEISDSVVDHNGSDAMTNLGLATIHRSTISHNRGDGLGTFFNTGDMTIVDSLIYNNHQDTAGGPGGIYNSGILYVVNTTITGNSSPDAGSVTGGIESYNRGFAEIVNSTVANNSGSNYSNISGGARLRNTVIYSSNTIDELNCSGDVISLGHNIANDDSCNLTEPTDQPNTDPLLGDLADNGGPTLTVALLTGSPAIDTGEVNCTDTEGAPLLTDQRGMPRPADGNDDGFAACDVGAYEVQPAVPTAPTIGTATAGNASASVAFTPGDLGSGTLINYTANCGGFTATGTSSPITVTGLTNGTAYTCKVRTSSSEGDSLWSADSNSVTPSGGGSALPAAPTIGTATPGDRSVIVSFTPNDLGSGTLRFYKSKCGSEIATSLSSPITVTGLTNGTTYTCTVRAITSVGNSPSSAESNPVTPSAGGSTLPTAPTIGTATPGNGRAIVAFTPGALGSGTLINYTAQCGSFTAMGTSSPLGVTGLTNGTTYTCQVKTTSSVGDSPWSAASNSVTPSASVPDAPTIGTATAGNASASVAFTPGYLGSGTLINYTANCGGFTATGTSSPITVTGLTNGTAYTCKVRTSSSEGDSLWSADSNSVTPSGGGSALPAAPTIGTATPGDRSAIVSFTPNDLGSGTLRFYKSKCGSETATSTSSPITVTGLTNGTTYTCTVRAITSVGNSPSSAESNPVTPSASAP